MSSKAALKGTSPALAGQDRRPRHSLKPKEYPQLNHSLHTCWKACRGIVLQKPSSSIAFVLTEDSMQRMWLEHLVRWSYYYEPVLLEGIGRSLRQGRTITAQQLAYLKDLKNVGDDLRNFFQLFSVGHETPPYVQSLVKLVGQVRDQVRLKETRRAGEKAKELAALLAKAGPSKWPRLKVDTTAMNRYLRARIAEMKGLLRREKMTALEFHQMKKDFRLLFSVYYHLRQTGVRPPSKSDVFLATKTVIKKMHRLLLAYKYGQKLKYRIVLIALPEEFRGHLLRLLANMRIRTTDR